jgi:hypothetical protein
MMKKRGIFSMAETVVRSCLAQVPILSVTDVKQPETGEQGPDFLLKLVLPAGELKLVIEVAENGQPRIARLAVNQLQRYLPTIPNAYGVFVAPYISPRAAEICTREGVGYIDLAGNCRLSFDGVFIERQGIPNPSSEKRSLRSLYSPKATRVLRVLLSAPGKCWRVKELSDEARVSFGQVSNVKKLLLDREWIRESKQGLALVEPEQLLTEWAQNYNFRRNQTHDFYSLKPIADIESDLAQICREANLRYALTGFSGAARLAPMVRYQRASAFVEGWKDDLATALDLKSVASGANVNLLNPYDEGVFYGSRLISGLQVASPIQLYLDLLTFRGRGEEAAKAILEKEIRPAW